MSLSIGIVGLPNVGKSTLFNALTNNSILAANYPFATIEPNTGTVPVPDARLSVLEKMYQAKKVIPASVTFVDIAGLVAGAGKGEGLGNKFLANIRQCDAIVHVVRAFENSDIIHTSDVVDPKADIEIITTELILADLQTLENRLQKLHKESKARPAARADMQALQAVKNDLEAGTPINRQLRIDDELISDLHLLTAKPVIFAFNVDEAGLKDTSFHEQLARLTGPNDTVIFLCAALEDELKELTPEDASELLESYGVNEPGLNKLITAAYTTLGLQSYLTAGPQEVRAWTIKNGSTAPQAAGVIHGDFERGFIAAQIIDFDDLVRCGSEVAAKADGKVRTEGKEYIMRPDDIVEFRFNV